MQIQGKLWTRPRGTCRFIDTWWTSGQADSWTNGEHTRADRRIQDLQAKDVQDLGGQADSWTSDGQDLGGQVDSWTSDGQGLGGHADSCTSRGHADRWINGQVVDKLGQTGRFTDKYLTQAFY